MALPANKQQQPARKVAYEPTKSTRGPENPSIVVGNVAHPTSKQLEAPILTCLGLTFFVCMYVCSESTNKYFIIHPGTPSNYAAGTRLSININLF